MHELMKRDMEENIESIWNPELEAERQDMLDAFLADLCLARFDREKRCYLLTDWYALGFGAVIMQPADDAPSVAVMKREMAGRP